VRFNLISNINNGVGLQRDYELLRGLLEGYGHQVNGVQFDGQAIAPDADVNIFLEVVVERFFGSAKWQWVVPNPEWWFKGWDAQLKKFEWVLCKTRHCEALFSAKGANTRFLGWKSQDFYNPDVPRLRKVLHLAGKSQTKNSDVVLNCWRHVTPPVDLTVVSVHYGLRTAPRVQHFGRITDEQLSYLMNSHQIHLMPSAYEGWGHALHEAMGVGAVVITTGAPPMNEIGSEFLLPSTGTSPHHSANLHRVNPFDVGRMVSTVLKHSDAELHAIGKANRAQFLKDNADFEQRLRELVCTAS
jgi:glycosyltransferase involved in cell wall biosynthesis